MSSTRLIDGVMAVLVRIFQRFIPATQVSLGIGVPKPCSVFHLLLRNSTCRTVNLTNTSVFLRPRWGIGLAITRRYGTPSVIVMSILRQSSRYNDRPDERSSMGALSLRTLPPGRIVAVACSN